MAYEWVAPVSTAATGIAGVGFAWLTGRSNAKAQLELTKRQQLHERGGQLRLEKREVFAGFLERLDQLDRALSKDGSVCFIVVDRAKAALAEAQSEGQAPDDAELLIAGISLLPDEDINEREESVERLRAAFEDLDGEYQRVSLCGSRSVRLAALALREDALKATWDAADGEWRYPEHELRAAVITTMRADLGYGESDVGDAEG